MVLTVGTGYIVDHIQATTCIATTSIGIRRIIIIKGVIRGHKVRVIIFRHVIKAMRDIRVIMQATDKCRTAGFIRIITGDIRGEQEYNRTTAKLTGTIGPT